LLTGGGAQWLSDGLGGPPPRMEPVAGRGKKSHNKDQAPSASGKKAKKLCHVPKRGTRTFICGGQKRSFPSRKTFKKECFERESGKEKGKAENPGGGLGPKNLYTEGGTKKGEPTDPPPIAAEKRFSSGPTMKGCGRRKREKRREKGTGVFLGGGEGKKRLTSQWDLGNQQKGEGKEQGDPPPPPGGGV